MLGRTRVAADGAAVAVQAAGEGNLLVEFGPPELDLAMRVHARGLAAALEGRTGVIDLTEGIRSLQVHFDPAAVGRRRLLGELLDLARDLPEPATVALPARTVHLPLSWDDPAAQLAVDRYAENVRPDAPWCPSNLEFIRRINGLDDVEQVREIVFAATYLVMGLGDVYLGAPVAVPLDPRHRLVTTKYTPPRTWTPENAVGIGGTYLCVYGIEGPGGYQLLGRTLPIWDRRGLSTDFEPGHPWLLRAFDHLRFDPVSAEELLGLREDFAAGRHNLEIREHSFRLADAERELAGAGAAIDAVVGARRAAFTAERERWSEAALPA
jgi:urea carboxylase